MHRHRINIDVTKIGRTALCSNFPILLYLSSASGINDDNVTSIFSALGANSRKIAVTTNDGTTQCYVEVEQWDNTNNRGWLWVKVPTLSNTDNTRLYFYYNASRPDNTAYVASGICPTASQNVWDANYMAVFHCVDNTTSLVKDSTANNVDGTKAAANTPLQFTAGALNYPSQAAARNDCWFI